MLVTEMENSEVYTVVSYSSLYPKNMAVLKLSLLCFMGQFIEIISVSTRTCSSLVIFNVQTTVYVFQFFVAVDYDTKDDRLWYEKYSIRKPMLPSFISMELGTKVSIAM